MTLRRTTSLSCFVAISIYCFCAALSSHALELSNSLSAEENSLSAEENSLSAEKNSLSAEENSLSTMTDKQTAETATITVATSIANTSTATEKRKHRNLTLIISEPFVELRTGPADSYPVHFVAQRGELIEILKRRTQWFKVTMQVEGHRSKTGWVHADDVAKTVASDTGTLAIKHPLLQSSYASKISAGFTVGQFSDADNVGGLIALKLSPSASVEIFADEYFGLDEEGFYLGVQANYAPWTFWRLTPMISLGYGYIERQFKGSLILQNDVKDNFLQTGSGINFHLSERFRLRLEYKHFNVLTSTDDNKELENWSISFISQL